ncbi:winged helix-turn-helix domain-containing protein [Kribbella speibonae]|uniref:Winged helix family transcriptional regulator n=1 Tax=Kribbella speibonae TaxID=1572660 RepID=A0A4R0IS78_9ACTN|nr:winged helix-turn-helix domain-containing protein [Kribbella speibonae]TCC34198.1 winged helix family transcriptional regulator [Kribbella speibonae]
MPIERPSDASLVIGVAASTAERVHLARLLGGADALLLVSNADQARAFLELTGVTVAPTAAVDVQAVPTVAAAAERRMQAVREPEPVAELRLDVDRRVVRWKDREMPLTRLEHDFLHCLVAEPGRVWTYQRLHHAVWGNEHLGHGSHIHSVVKRLRQKLANLGATVTIHAVRGVGFHLLPTT